MKKQDLDILNILFTEPYINQRILSETSGYSLGAVNNSIKSLTQAGYLDDEVNITNKARAEFQAKSPKNAIILAAGVGMRMVPINTQSPKALMEVNGEPLVERIIKQLHEIEVTDIYVVVGFMKEQFEYLIDQYGVELIVNEEYGVKNNLHSLALCTGFLGNSYIVPGDIWCNTNPFKKNELYSWYMVTDAIEKDSTVRVNRKKELVSVPMKQGGNAMIGVAYLVEEQSKVVMRRLKLLDCDSRYDNTFWEETLFDNDKMIVQAKVVNEDEAIEINTFEQLRELDEQSNHLKSDAIKTVEKALDVSCSDIKEIKVMKKGMTNRSFLFTCRDKKYIMRIPGEGTDQLINRREEAEVYKTIDGKNICDNIIYIDPNNGYKITEFVDNSRTCDPNNTADLVACMKKLREFHSLKLTVDHEFDVFEQIEYYESLWGENVSIYRDYKTTKEKVFSLKKYIDKHVHTRCLSHIDAVPDNFLFTEDGEVKLIDWEYAGIQDPHIDIAMFCIYSLYNRNQIDNLINIYFNNECPREIRIKIYCYISVCGLLWSNWTEYKRILGAEFGEYSLRQYRYAKDYYKIVMSEEEVAHES